MCCNTLILTPRMYWLDNVNVVNMQCMIPSVEFKAKAPLVNDEAYKSNYFICVSHVLERHGRNAKAM